MIKDIIGFLDYFVLKKGDEERPEDEKEKAVVVIQQLFRRYLAKGRLQKDAEVHILFIVIIHVYM